MQRLVASLGALGSQSSTNFSQDVTPIPCHLRNDYWRKIPLYEALAAGCTSVEANVWLRENDLLVGHPKGSLTSAKTLNTLYIDPLVSILTHRNPTALKSNTTDSTQANGIFETDLKSPFTLLIDMKTTGPDTLPAVLQHLEPLRSRGWLTHYSGTTVIPSLVTVVGTGNTSFDMLNSNSTHRDTFFDAPLDRF